MPGIGPRITFARSGLNVNWSTGLPQHPRTRRSLRRAHPVLMPKRRLPHMSDASDRRYDHLQSAAAGRAPGWRRTDLRGHTTQRRRPRSLTARPPDGPSPPTKHGISGPEEEPQENQIGIVTLAAKAPGTEDADTRITITCRARAQRITRTALAAGTGSAQGFRPHQPQLVPVATLVPRRASALPTFPVHPLPSMVRSE